MTATTPLADADRFDPSSALPPPRPPTLFSAIRRIWPLLVVVAVALGFVTYGASERRDPVFEASSLAQLVSPADTTVFSGSVNARDLERLTTDEIERARSEEVQRAAAAKMGADWTTNRIRRTVTVRGDPTSSTLEFTARANTRTEAALLANAYLDAYVDVAVATERTRADALVAGLHEEARLLDNEAVSLIAEREARRTLIAADVAARTLPEEQTRELDRRLRLDQEYQQLERSLEVTQDEAASLRAEARRISIDAKLRSNGFVLAEEALPPEAPIAPNPRRDALLVGVVAFAALAAAAWVYAERRGPRYDATSVASVLGTSVVGVVPMQTPDRLPAPLQNVGKRAYRAAFATIDLEMRSRRSLAIAVSGTVGRPGRTTSAFNLARTAAERGLRVLVVDADPRGGRLSDELDLVDQAGWSDLASDSVLLSASLHTISLAGDDAVQMSVLPIGQVRDFPQGQLLRTRMGSLATRFDLVVFDTSALGTSEGDLIARVADRLLLVVDHALDHRELEELLARVTEADRPLLGVLRNRSDRGTVLGLARRIGRLARSSVQRPSPVAEGVPGWARTPAMTSPALPAVDTGETLT